MITRILVPTDFSEQAENALRVAADLARKNNAEIHLLHMLDLPMSLIDGPAGTIRSDLPEALFFMKLAHQKFEKIINAPFLKGIVVHEAAAFEKAFKGIIDYAIKHAIDMTVMGSHGDSGLHEFFIGSNAEKVVRNSNIPVLIIKKRHTPFKMNNFVYATDFKEENHNAFKQAIAFARDNNIKMHLLYINTPTNFKTTQNIESLMEAFMEKESLANENYTLNIYNDNTLESGILHFAEIKKADIVGIGTHGRKGLAHFLNGSLSEGLVNHAQRPIITFRI